jgi:osmotically-inducible protein OsmY
MKNDLEIQKDVLAEFDRGEKVPTGSIGVEVHRGIVKLAGRNMDPTVSKQAELSARRVEGVTEVILDMNVTRC